MKNQRGITLIALVITIIVLLILAGITITLLMGENGVLNRAHIATIKTEQGLILEQLRTEMYEKRLDIGNKQKEIDYLKDKQIVKTVMDTNSETSLDVLEYSYLEEITKNTITGKGDLASGDIYYIENGNLYYKDQDKESIKIGELFVEVANSDNVQDLKWIYHENEEGNMVITGIDLSDYSYENRTYDVEIFFNKNILTVPSKLEGKTVVKLNLNGNDFILPEKASPDFDWMGSIRIKNIKTIICADTIEDISIEGVSFDGLQTLQLPQNLKEIRNHAFYGYASLTTVIIPKSVTSIGEYAFSSQTLNFKDGKNDALEIPENKWGAGKIIINGVEY